MSTYTWRTAKTVVVLAVSFKCGLDASTVFTTLPDMEVRTSSDTAEMSAIFVWVGLACIAGSLSVGSLFDRVNGMLLMSIGVIVLAVSLALAPTWPNLTAFHALVAVNFFSQGGLTPVTGCITMLQHLWRGSGVWLRPMILADDLTYILGMAIGPQIVRPFLVDRSHSVPNGTANDTSTVNFYGGLHTVQIPYLIGGAASVILAIACMTILTASWVVTQGEVGRLQACLRNNDSHYEDIGLIPDNPETSENNKDRPSSPDKISPNGRQGIVFLAIILILFIAETAYDSVFTGLLFTYVYEYLKWSADASTSIISAHNATRTVVLFAVVMVSPCISPTWVVVFNLAAMTASAVLMLAAQVNGGVPAVTAAGIIVAGMSSSKFAALVTHVDDNLHISAPVMALILSSWGASTVVVTPFSGILLHHVGPVSYPALVLAISLAIIALVLVYMMVARKIRSKRLSAEN